MHRTRIHRHTHTHTHTLWCNRSLYVRRTLCRRTWIKTINHLSAKFYFVRQPTSPPPHASNIPLCIVLFSVLYIVACLTKISYTTTNRPTERHGQNYTFKFKEKAHTHTHTHVRSFRREQQKDDHFRRVMLFTRWTVALNWCNLCCAIAEKNVALLVFEFKIRSVNNFPVQPTKYPSKWISCACHTIGSAGFCGVHFCCWC